MPCLTRGRGRGKVWDRGWGRGIDDIARLLVIFCEYGDFQIRKHLKIGNEVEGSNCFNIDRLLFLPKLVSHMV